jgi:hypothetical protein
VVGLLAVEEGLVAGRVLGDLLVCQRHVAVPQLGRVLLLLLSAGEGTVVRVTVVTVVSWGGYCC